MRARVPRLAALLAIPLPLLLAPAPAAGQGLIVPPPSPGTGHATGAPAPRYQAGSFHRLLLGSDWRDLWATPITLPVLGIDTFAGGLTPEREGGNRQSKTLHFVDAAGVGWVFRSLDKYPEEKLGIGGLVDWLIQDQVSAMYPAGEVVLPPLLDALGILHVVPVLYVMPDAPALGEFRETFAGMIGAMELKPDEEEGDEPGFAGSRKTVNAFNMADRLEESPRHRVDERELLRVRLLDFIINDTDRTMDQYRFTRFPDESAEDRYVWRPVPRDRDLAFHSADGLLVGPLLGSLYPKFTGYGPEHASVGANTFSSHLVDRRMLTRITRADVDAEVALVRERLTDQLIDDAVARLPEAFPEEDRRRLATAMTGRRDRLDEAADAFYAWLATEVDVRATDHGDRAEIDRHPDGSVEVVLSPRPEAVDPDYDGDLDEAPAATDDPYYNRVFLPHETREVRVYLHGGDDVAVVRGPRGPIRIRVIGGGGDDVLMDFSGAGGVHLYDHRGDNRFIGGDRTHIDRRDWDAPDVPEGVRFGSDWAPDWGRGRGWAPAADYREYAGIIIGAGPQWTRYGFRRLPYHWRASVQPLLSLATFRPGIRAGLDYRLENSFHSFEVGGRWTAFDAIRWFGPGNDTEWVDRDLSIVPLNRGRLDAALVLRFGAWRTAGELGGEGVEAMAAAGSPPTPLRATLSFGPTLAHTDPRPRADGPYDLDPAAHADDSWEAGARIALDVLRSDRSDAPRRGFRLRSHAEGYPWSTTTEPFARLAAEGNAYLPVSGDVHFAFRIGGAQTLGDVPPWHAATIGGLASLRGFDYQRFTGDRAVYGGAELRVPITEISFLATGELGVFALADAGRVWHDGASPGPWHTGLGAGLWYSVLGRAITFAYAVGEQGRPYLSLGLSY